MIKPNSFIIALFFSISLFAQEKSPVKFGKISPEDFKSTVYSIDSNADAVVIADIGSSQIIGNNKGWFSLEHRHFKRMHILRKSGYEAGDVQIMLFTNGNNEEKIQNLKAYTYNLENGKVIETRLDTKSSVFRDKFDRNHILLKFTFPNIKEGSVIEFDYTLTSDFLFNFQPWEFQGEYPCLWSEYEVSIPDFLYYVFLSQGLQYNFSRTQKTFMQHFRVLDSRGAGASEAINFDNGVTDTRMIMKNIPALKEESFTSTIQNYIAKVEFQLAATRQPLTPEDVMGNWNTVCEKLLSDPDFGQQLSRDNNWLADDLAGIVRKNNSEMEKAKAIYYYLQKNFTCTNHNRTETDQPLKNILRDKKGSEAEINLLLTAMLRKAGLVADPVMLSTKEHGYVYPLYPLIDRFNYVICRTTIGGKNYFLDASRTHLGFGRLHWNCYNGQARVINTDATALDFNSDSLVERKITSLYLSNDEKGNMAGVMKESPGYYESYSLRGKIKEKGKEEFLKDIKKDFGADAELSNIQVDSLDNVEDLVQLKYEVKLNLDKEDIIYLNPMFGEGYKENPFKSAIRTYPVEMPYAFDKTYLLTMDVPQGYEVDELPKSVKVNLDEEGTSYFEYIIASSNGVISMRSRVKMNRTFFQPDEYEILREFYNLVVSKQSEQIVFKKKK